MTKEQRIEKIACAIGNWCDSCKTCLSKDKCKCIEEAKRVYKLIYEYDYKLPKGE